MAFAPLDYHSLASRLVTNPEFRQASLRSAVSRGFYAVFLSIKAEVVGRGFDFPQREAHGKLKKALRETRIRHLADLSRDLTRLQARREVADYELEAEFTQTEAQDILERCERAIQSARRVGDDHYMRLGAQLR